MPSQQPRQKRGGVQHEGWQRVEAVGVGLVEGVGALERVVCHVAIFAYSRCLILNLFALNIFRSIQEQKFFPKFYL